MTQLPDGPRLASEAFPLLGAHDALAVQRLDRHEAMQRDLASQEHGPKSTATELADNLVAPAEVLL